MHPAGLMPRALPLLLLPVLILACGDSEESPGEDASVPDLPSVPDLGLADASDGPELQRPDAWVPPPIEGWAPCRGDRGLECAFYTVPLDPDTFEGTVDLHVTRAPARDPSRRIGVLFVNPGGPGGASGPMVEQLSQRHEIADRFDIVGVDPRGVGESSPIDCVSAELKERLRPADTIEAQSEVVAELTEMCTSREDPALLARMSTAYAVQDLDWVRAALGEDKINFLGTSYGGRLGASYASRFPARLRAFVLDAPASPGADYREIVRQRVEAQESQLQAFFEHCGRAGSSCSFHRGEGTQAVQAAYDALLLSAVEGIAVPNTDRRLYTTDLRRVTDVGIATGSADSLGALLGALERGEAAQLLALADQFTSRQPDGSYLPLMEQNLSVTCGDYFGPTRLSTSDLRTTLSEVAATAPRSPLGGITYLACEGWPPALREPLTIGARNAPPLLVIGGEADPWTPMSWAIDTVNSLNNGSHLVRSDHVGHVGLFRAGLPFNRARDFLIDPSQKPDELSCRRTVTPPPQGAEVIELGFFLSFFPALTSSLAVTLEVMRRTDHAVLASTVTVARPDLTGGWYLEVPTEGEPLDFYLQVQAPGYRISTEVPGKPLSIPGPGRYGHNLVVMNEAELATRFPGQPLDPAAGYVVTRFRDCDGRRTPASLAPSPPPGQLYHGRAPDGTCYSYADQASSDASCGFAVVVNVPPSAYRAQYTSASGVVISGPEYRVLPGSYNAVTISP